MYKIHILASQNEKTVEISVSVVLALAFLSIAENRGSLTSEEPAAASVLNEASCHANNHTFVSYRTCEQASISGTAEHLASVIFLSLRHFPIPGNAAFTAVAIYASAHHTYYNN